MVRPPAAAGGSLCGCKHLETAVWLELVDLNTCTPVTRAGRWPWRTSTDVPGAARTLSHVTGKPDHSLEHPDSRFSLCAHPGVVEYYTALKGSADQLWTDNAHAN